jgi:hypothetical protein
MSKLGREKASLWNESQSESPVATEWCIAGGILRPSIETEDFRVENEQNYCVLLLGL